MITKISETKWWRIFSLLMLLTLTACGGGGGGGGGTQPPSNNPTYTVGGSASGITGTGLVLRINGGDDLAVDADNTFTFTTPLADGDTYSVTVASSPASQTCTINNGSGTISGADITNVSVTCANIPVGTYTVGGTASGITGTGLVLRNNGGEDLAVDANDVFTFTTPLADGETYSVTVASNPASQTCAVTNESGTISGANVTNITVTCTTNPPPPTTFTIGGTASGITGTGLVLRNNGGDNLIVDADGDFTFATSLSDGATYSVTVASNPTSQTCTANNKFGTISGANIINVTVTCVSVPAGTYTVGGTASGITAPGLVLRNNGSVSSVSVDIDSHFTFPLALANGAPYNVTVYTNPPSQTCAVSNGSGNISGASITDIVVTCVDNTPPTGTYTVGGTASGITGTGLVLRNNGGDDLAVDIDNGFTFATAVANGSGYSVSIASNPASQSCYVTDGYGTISGADVSNITVTCEPAPASGVFDLHFNAPNGYAMTDLGSNSNDYAYATAIQPDGRILLAGKKNGSFALVRYNTDGTLDTTFGPGGTGIVTTTLMSLNAANAIVVQPGDGKIVIAGTINNTTTGNKDFAVLRYDTDGNLDTTFGPAGDGTVTTDFASRDDIAYAIALDSVGNIVVAGSSSNTTSGMGDIAIARYDSAGNLDTTFAGNGKKRTNITRTTGTDDDDVAYALVIAPGDKPVIAGTSGYIDSVLFTSSYDFVLARYNSDGTRDTAFGPNGTGFVYTDFNGGTDEVRAMVRDSSGNLVVAGRAHSGPLSGLTVDFDFALARYNAQGILDTSGFGTGGKTTHDFGFNADDYAYALALQTDGKIVVAGHAELTPDTHFGLLRLGTSGNLDTSFSFGTGVWTWLLGTYSEARAISIQDDGKLVAAGYANSGTGFDMAVMRINP